MPVKTRKNRQDDQMGKPVLIVTMGYQQRSFVSRIPAVAGSENCWNWQTVSLIPLYKPGYMEE